MDKKVMLLIYVLLTLFLVIWMLLFASVIVPLFVTIIFPERLWFMWLLSGAFVGPVMLVLVYVVVRMTGSLWQFDRTQWKIAIIGTPLAFMFLAGLGYAFSHFISSDFEPFRSFTLPCLVLMLVFIAISRMKFIKKYQVTGKQPSPG